MKLIAVTASEFAERRWRAPQGYAIAAADAVATLVAHEIPRAVLTMPVAFIKQADEFNVVAVQGLQPGKNLFVAADGRWSHGYIPAAYRGYPFVAATAEGGEQVLCFDEDSELLSETDGQLFYGTDGELSNNVKQIADFLSQVMQNRALTKQMCGILQQHNLIEPWSITLAADDAEQNVSGLYKVDEPALKQLSADALKQLSDAGALSLAYLQLVSTQHLPKLIEMAKASVQAAQASQVVELDFLQGNNHSIDFSSL